MAWIYEILANVILLVTRPFSLFKLACLLGFRTTYVVICTLMELARAAISFHVNMIWGIITWTIGLVFLPVRVANALERDKQVSSLFCSVCVYIYISFYLYNIQALPGYKKFYLKWFY